MTGRSMRRISDLSVHDGALEWEVAPLLKHLLEGWLVEDIGYFKLEKNNVPTSTEDLDAKFRVDYRFCVNGKTVGFLDVEYKLGWTDGDWPWPWVNVARHPMQHWQHDSFNGRPTNKLLSFQQKPQTSIWLGVRRDGRAALPVPAQMILRHGEEYLQPTSYDPKPLPVLRLKRSSLGPVFGDPQEITDYLVYRVLLNVS